MKFKKLLATLVLTSTLVLVGVNTTSASEKPTNVTTYVHDPGTGGGF
jgi:hypothetical protein